MGSVEIRKRAVAAPLWRRHRVVVMVRHVGGVLFVLLASFGVVLLLLPPAFALHANHYGCRDECGKRRCYGKYGNQHNLATAETVTAAAVCLLMTSSHVRRDTSGCRAPAGRQCFLVTRCSPKTSRTNALVAVDTIYARSTIFARR